MRPLQNRVLTLDLVAGLLHAVGDHREVRAVQVDQLEQHVDFGSRPLVSRSVAGSTTSLFVPKGNLVDKVVQGVFGEVVGGLLKLVLAGAGGEGLNCRAISERLRHNSEHNSRQR